MDLAQQQFGDIVTKLNVFQAQICEIIKPETCKLAVCAGASKPRPFPSTVFHRPRLCPMVPRGSVTLRAEVGVVVDVDPEILSSGSALKKHGKVETFPRNTCIHSEVCCRPVPSVVWIGSPVIAIDPAIAVEILAQQIAGRRTLRGCVVDVLPCLRDPGIFIRVKKSVRHVNEHVVAGVSGAKSQELIPFLEN